MAARKRSRDGLVHSPDGRAPVPRVGTERVNRNEASWEEYMRNVSRNRNAIKLPGKKRKRQPPCILFGSLVRATISKASRNMEGDKILSFKKIREAPEIRRLSDRALSGVVKNPFEELKEYVVSDQYKIEGHTLEDIVASIIKQNSILTELSIDYVTRIQTYLDKITAFLNQNDLCIGGLKKYNTFDMPADFISRYIDSPNQDQSRVIVALRSAIIEMDDNHFKTYLYNISTGKKSKFIKTLQDKLLFGYLNGYKPYKKIQLYHIQRQMAKSGRGLPESYAILRFRQQQTNPKNQKKNIMALRNHLSKIRTIIARHCSQTVKNCINYTMQTRNFSVDMYKQYIKILKGNYMELKRELLRVIKLMVDHGGSKYKSNPSGIELSMGILVREEIEAMLGEVPRKNNKRLSDVSEEESSLQKIDRTSTRTKRKKFKRNRIANDVRKRRRDSEMIRRIYDAKNDDEKVNFVSLITRYINQNKPRGRHLSLKQVQKQIVPDIAYGKQPKPTIGFRQVYDGGRKIDILDYLKRIGDVGGGLHGGAPPYETIMFKEKAFGSASSQYASDFMRRILLKAVTNLLYSRFNGMTLNFVGRVHNLLYPGRTVRITSLPSGHLKTTNRKKIGQSFIGRVVSTKFKYDCATPTNQKHFVFALKPGFYDCLLPTSRAKVNIKVLARNSYRSHIINMIPRARNLIMSNIILRTTKNSLCTCLYIFDQLRTIPDSNIPSLLKEYGNVDHKKYIYDKCRMLESKFFNHIYEPMGPQFIEHNTRLFNDMSPNPELAGALLGIYEGQDDLLDTFLVYLDVPEIDPYLFMQNHFINSPRVPGDIRTRIPYRNMYFKLLFLVYFQCLKQLMKDMERSFGNYATKIILTYISIETGMNINFLSARNQFPAVTKNAAYRDPDIKRHVRRSTLYALGKMRNEYQKVMGFISTKLKYRNLMTPGDHEMFMNIFSYAILLKLGVTRNTLRTNITTLTDIQVEIANQIWLKSYEGGDRYINLNDNMNMEQQVQFLSSISPQTNKVMRILATPSNPNSGEMHNLETTLDLIMKKMKFEPIVSPMNDLKYVELEMELLPSLLPLFRSRIAAI